MRPLATTLSQTAPCGSTRTGVCIAVLGAESTGKTWLCRDVADHLRQQGIDAVVVPEVLRQWCESYERTPRQDEQQAIAQTQAAAIALARQRHTVVIADTTPLMVAVYSDLLFNDPALYPAATQQQRELDTTLLMGLDLPWVADGIQRDGPHVRAPVDARVRRALASANLPFHVVYGQGATRLQSALSALQALLARCNASRDLLSRTASNTPLSIANNLSRTTARTGFYDENGQSTWTCDKCSDPVCEHRLFTRLISARPSSSSGGQDVR